MPRDPFDSPPPRGDPFDSPPPGAGSDPFDSPPPPAGLIPASARPDDDDFEFSPTQLLKNAAVDIGKTAAGVVASPFVIGKTAVDAIGGDEQAQAALKEMPLYAIPGYDLYKSYQEAEGRGKSGWRAVGRQLYENPVSSGFLNVSGVGSVGKVAGKIGRMGKLAEAGAAVERVTNPFTYLEKGIKKGAGFYREKQGLPAVRTEAAKSLDKTLSAIDTEFYGHGRPGRITNTQKAMAKLPKDRRGDASGVLEFTGEGVPDFIQQSTNIREASPDTLPFREAIRQMDTENKRAFGLTDKPSDLMMMQELHRAGFYFGQKPGVQIGDDIPITNEMSERFNALMDQRLMPDGSEPGMRVDPEILAGGAADMRGVTKAKREADTAIKLAAQNKSKRGQVPEMLARVVDEYDELSPTGADKIEAGALLRQIMDEHESQTAIYNKELAAYNRMKRKITGPPTPPPSLDKMLEQAGIGSRIGAEFTPQGAGKWKGTIYFPHRELPETQKDMAKLAGTFVIGRGKDQLPQFTNRDLEGMKQRTGKMQDYDQDLERVFTSSEVIKEALLSKQRQFAEIEKYAVPAQDMDMANGKATKYIFGEDGKVIAQPGDDLVPLPLAPFTAIKNIGVNLAEEGKGKLKPGAKDYDLDAQVQAARSMLENPDEMAKFLDVASNDLANIEMNRKLLIQKVTAPGGNFAEMKDAYIWVTRDVADTIKKRFAGGGDLRRSAEILNALMKKTMLSNPSRMLNETIGNYVLMAMHMNPGAAAVNFAKQLGAEMRDIARERGFNVKPGVDRSLYPKVLAAGQYNVDAMAPNAGAFRTGMAGAIQDRLDKWEKMPGVRIGVKYSQVMRGLAERIEAAARRTTYDMRLAKNMADSARNMGELGAQSQVLAEKWADIERAGDIPYEKLAPIVKKSIDETAQILGGYGGLQPWEKNVMLAVPFFRFTKHMYQVGYRMGLERPEILYAITKLQDMADQARQDIKEYRKRGLSIPPGMEQLVPIGKTKDGKTRYLDVGNYNPFSAIMGGTGDSPLGLSPAVGLLSQAAFGVDPTGRTSISPQGRAEGQTTPAFSQVVARVIPQVNTLLRPAVRTLIQDKPAASEYSDSPLFGEPRYVLGRRSGVRNERTPAMAIGRALGIIVQEKDIDEHVKDQARYDNLQDKRAIRFERRNERVGEDQ